MTYDPLGESFRPFAEVVEENDPRVQKSQRRKTSRTGSYVKLWIYDIKGLTLKQTGDTNAMPFVLTFRMLPWINHELDHGWDIILVRFQRVSQGRFYASGLLNVLPVTFVGLCDLHEVWLKLEVD